MNNLHQNSETYLQVQRSEITDGSVGSADNRAATLYFEDMASSFGWDLEVNDFDAMDWIDGEASLHYGAEGFQAFVSPYSLGCQAEGQLISVSTIGELEQEKLTEKYYSCTGKSLKSSRCPRISYFTTRRIIAD
jgi:aminopeptidase YwaD